VLIRWMERIDAGIPPLILGDGKTSMDFIYIDDIARANVAGSKSEVSDEVFNVASEVETTLLELAETLMRVMGKNLQPEFGPERKVNAVPRRLASTEKAQRLLGWKAQVSLEEGLERLVNWWRVNKEHVA
jgi:UDP-glucose 4-epimerase